MFSRRVILVPELVNFLLLLFPDLSNNNESVKMKIYDINKHAKGIINDQNNSPIDDFDGLSPSQMEQLLYHPFEGNTVIKFAKKAKYGIFVDSPLFLIAWELLTLASQGGGIKLTSKGYLPLKLVKSIYNRGYLPDDLIDDGDIELRSEDDWLLLFVTKQLLMISDFAEIQGNMFTLTKMGSELLAQKADYEVYMELLKAFCLGFSWASNDGYGSEEIGQLGFMYMLHLLKKYGDVAREPDFYDEKYFRAFPMLTVDTDEDEDDEEDSDPDYIPDPEYVPDPEEERMDCLDLRFFERFCLWFNLAEVEMDFDLPAGEFSFEMFESIGQVKRSKLFERIIV